MEECPDAELDDQLCDALDKRLEGGDVPHVVGSFLHPLWVADHQPMRSPERKILRPNLEGETLIRKRKTIE